MAEELLSCVSEYSYIDVIPCLTMDDFVPLRHFPSSELGKLFIIDWSGCKPEGVINNSHLFELFGKFSTEDAESVRSDILDRIESGAHVYEKVGAEFFLHREWSFKDWALTACSNYYYGDELLLFALCRVHHHHALLVYHDCYWTTLQPKDNMTLSELLEACDVYLVYLRPGIFGELRLKKKYTGITEFASSLPEFPSWSGEGADTTIVSMPGLKGFVDNDLLYTYLNIKLAPSEDEQSVGDNVACNGRNKLPVGTEPNPTLSGGNDDITPILNNIPVNIASTDPDHHTVQSSEDDIDWVIDDTPDKLLNPIRLKENIDPYSSLEDVGDTTSDKLQQGTDEPNTEANSVPTSPIKTRLRSRKPIRSDSGCPRHSASKNVSYKNMYEELDLPPTPKQPK